LRAFRSALLTIGAATSVAMLVTGGSAAAGATSARTPAAHPATATITRYQGVPGVATAGPANRASASGTPSRRQRGVRRVQLEPTSRLVTGAPSLPEASGQTTPAASTVVHNFNGVSSLDSEKTNFNAEFSPPDPGLCAGNGFVLEAVNSAYTIYRDNGTKVRGPFNVNDLFDEGAAEFTSDPRCWYDPSTHAWFAVVLYLNSSFTASRMDVAVNTSGDPTTLWHQFRINTTNSGGHGCPCFGDQPLLGIDRHNIYLSTNEFSINGPAFNGAQIYAISKADLLAGKNARYVHFANLRMAGHKAASVQPALTASTSNAEYFLSSLDPQGSGDNRLGVWAMTHREAVSQGGTPVLTSTVISAESYRSPPPAQQGGTTAAIDSGDDRMQQAEFVGGTLWGELTTGIHLANDAKMRAGAAWFAVRPWLRGDSIGGAAVKRQGYVVQHDGYVIYPAIQPDAAGRAAMVFTVTGSRQFPSAAYAVIGAGAAAFGPVRVAAAGTGPYVVSGKSTRWGDYSFAVPAPVGDAAWLATEYVPPVNSQTTDGRSNWGTRVFEVKLH